MGPVKVLFVCMGNICRSPTAEGVFRKLVSESGLVERIVLDLIEAASQGLLAAIRSKHFD